jgi:hypothetical protein
MSRCLIKFQRRLSGINDSNKNGIQRRKKEKCRTHTSACQKNNENFAASIVSQNSA